MPLVNLAATRARLMRFGWIREARVSRRLPDTLVIDILERQPVAIWQNNQQLSLIDADGVVLEPVRIDHMPNLPLVIGPDANRHMAGLGALLQAAQVVTSELELDAVLQRLVDEVAGLLRAEAVDCFLLDSERDVLRCAAVHGLPDEMVGFEFPADSGLAGRAIARGR